MKIVPQLDKYQRLVSFGQSAFGKPVLLTAFLVGLYVIRVASPLELTAAIALMTYFPARRRLLLSFATLYWLLFHSGWLNWTFLRSLAKAEGQRTDWPLTVFIAGIVAAMFGVLAVFFHYVHTRRTFFVTKRPVLCLVTCSLLLLFAAGLLPVDGAAHALLWAVIVVSTPYLWYFAYALKDASVKNCDSAALQFGTLRPFWGPINVPQAKGAANLRRVEARTSEALCITQLKAIKLLIWVFVLHIAYRVLQVVVFGEPTLAGPVVSIANSFHLDVPNLGVSDLVVALQQPGMPLSLAWSSVVAHFAKAVIEMTIRGNIVIACIRMAGFNVLRNTYKPLQSRTVADFWNRYNYYFKELLVEFFFFPTFMRYFKRYERLRLFAATMAAATVGNMVFHFVRDYFYVAQMGLWRALVGFQVYFFYSAVLGVGIGISQLRNHGKTRLSDDASWWRKALATTGVLIFFSLLEVFDQEGRSLNLALCMRFFLHLFMIPA